MEIHYNVDNNILTSILIINNIYIHSLRSIYLSTYLFFTLVHLVGFTIEIYYDARPHELQISEKYFVIYI